MPCPAVPGQSWGKLLPCTILLTPGSCGCCHCLQQGLGATRMRRKIVWKSLLSGCGPLPGADPAGSPARSPAPHGRAGEGQWEAGRGLGKAMLGPDELGWRYRGPPAGPLAGLAAAEGMQSSCHSRYEIQSLSSVRYQIRYLSRDRAVNAVI